MNTINLATELAKHDGSHIILPPENKWTTKQERAAIALETGLQPRKLRLQLLTLAESIRREVAPTLDAMREWDEKIESFIHSGRSLVDYVSEKRALPALPAWARLQAPPLPVGLPMPPNVCTNPAFNV